MTLPAKVVDASAAAAVIFDEPDSLAIAERLADFHLCAPALISYELANICVKKMKSHPDKRSRLVSVFGERDRFFQISEFGVALDAVAELARDNNLSAYDASYLWLARQLNVELVTLDKRLARVAAA